MALALLATVVDLSARGVDVSDEELALTMLAAASAAVREAAGSSISETTSTVTIEGVDGHRLVLPSGPVTGVSTVTVDGEAVTDYRLSGGSLWRPAGWPGACYGEPAQVEITYTHGYAVVPEDIVNLVCMFAIAGMHEASQGSRAGLAYESIDDYRVGYQQGAEATASAIEVPERTARMLRARFGGGTYVTSVAT